MKNKEHQYIIEDFNARGTLKEIAASLSKLAFNISTADPKEVDDNNDEDQSFYDDGKVSCSLFPLA
jgi:hypothetical protein